MARSGSSLEEQIRARLARIQRSSRTRGSPGPLLEWIPKVSPRYAAPRHLLPLINLLERIIAGERIRVVVHTPPRHGKTETLLHFIAWGLLQRPDWTFGYGSYNAGIALSKSRVARDLALQAGLQLPVQNAGEWRTLARGGTLAGGMQGTWTGHGLNVGIVDDPCVAEGELVRTRRGLVPIERVLVGDEVVTHLGRWRRVTAVHDNGVKDVISIAAGANKVRLTPTHLVCTPEGWQEARHAKEVVGEAVQDVPCDVQGAKAGADLLLERVPGQVSTGAAAALPSVPEVVSDGGRWAGRQVLLDGLRLGEPSHRQAGKVSRVPQALPDAPAGAEVLLGRVQAPTVAGDLEGRAEGEDQARRAVLVHPGLSQAPVARAQEGDRRVRRVRLDGEPDRAPPRRGQQEQQSGESDGGVQLVPHAISQVEGCGQARVYDLSVEEDHSFLAGGLAVHNCKNRVEAESAGARERAKEWFGDTFLTRVEPGGSVIVNMARWHPDDLAGYLVREKGWPYLCLPALSGEEEAGVMRALWPERWPVPELLIRKEEVGPYSWASLYQGQPRPRGGSVFGDPIAWGGEDGQIKLSNYCRFGMGLDLAFTAKSSSDWSVIVVMKEWEKQAFVWDVLRVQTRAPEFKQLVRRYREQYPAARIRWYAAGTEQGSADFFATPDYLPTGKQLAGIPVEVIRPNGDKFTRAIPYAASWNAKKVAVPGDSDAYPWVNKFIEEHVNFTGVGDLQDDQVDAAAAAHDLVLGPPSTYRSVRDAGGAQTTRRLT